MLLAIGSLGKLQDANTRKEIDDKSLYELSDHNPIVAEFDI